MFSAVPRPQSSIASLAPIAPPPNPVEPAGGPLSEAPAAPISVTPATAAPAPIAPAPVLPGPAGPSPEPTTSSRRQGFQGGGSTPESQSTISSPPPATFPPPSPIASPNKPIEPTIAAVTVAPPSKKPGLLGAPAPGLLLEGGSAAASLPSLEPMITAQPLPPASGATQSQEQAAVTAGVQQSSGVPPGSIPVLQPGSPTPIASPLPAQGEPHSQIPPSLGTSSSAEGEAPSQPGLPPETAHPIGTGSSASDGTLPEQPSSPDGEAPDQPAALPPIAVPAEEGTLLHGIFTPDPSPQVATNVPNQVTVMPIPGALFPAEPVPTGLNPASQISIGDFIITQDAPSHVILGQGPVTQTLFAGGPAITHSGAVISLAPFGDAVIFGPSTKDIASQFVIGSQTLSAGSPAITVNGQQLSIAKEGSQVIFSPSTQALSNPNIFTATQPAVVDIGGGQSVTANGASQFVIGSQTLKAGSAITAGGSTYSLASSASAIIINGHTSDLTASRVLATVAPPLITVGPSILSANSKSQYVVGSQTLSPGGLAITISGTRYSLGSGATDLVVGSSTEALKPQYLALSTEAPVLTMGSAQISAISGGHYVIGAQTLEPGQKITVSGTVLSLASDDKYLMIGTSTEKLHPTTVVASTTRTGLHRTTSTTSAASSSVGFESDSPSETIPAPTPSPTNGACRDQAFWSSMLVAVLAVALVIVQ